MPWLHSLDPVRRGGEAGAHDPPVGARLAWNVRVDGETWDEDSMTLEKPLDPNYAFFLQTGWEGSTA